jgi:predicted outer membrane repeat protein
MREVRRWQAVPKGLAVLSLVAVCLPAWAGICRVTTAGDIFNDGSSWAVPTSLTQALFAVNVCSEIWVAKGVYKPGTSVNSTFAVQPGAAVYGGFAGTETARTQRDPVANLTVLSGDIDNNDTIDANGVDVDTTHIVGNNSYHVVYMDGTGTTPIDANTVLDGFTITGGEAHGASLDANGGGLYCNGADNAPNSSDCSPSLSNLIFRGNHATYEGGAIFDIGNDTGHSSPAFTNVAFIGNRASSGGAMYNDAFDSNGSPSLLNVTFSGNVADGDGGAMFDDPGGLGTSDPILVDVTFSGNTAGGTGGALCHKVGIFGDSSPTLINVTFNGNQASSGGAIAFNVASSPHGTLTLRNVILWSDRVPLGQPGKEVYLNGVGTAIDHSIVQGSGGSAAWNSEFGTDGGGNLDVDPLLGSLAYNHGSTQTMLPGVGSPAIDAGNDTGCPTTDQRGIVRPQGAHCDIGAVETFAVDLIGHKGYEECWSKALTKPGFLDLIQSDIEGNVACLPPIFTTATNYACNTAACPGGAMGCPLTTQASAFGVNGSFSDGNFSAAGSVSDVSVPVTLGGSYNCTIKASGIATSYTPSYVFTDDGNFGEYAALLNRFEVTLTVNSLSSTDVNCGVYAAVVGPMFTNNAQAAVASSLRQKLQDSTIGQSVCPKSP